MTAALRVNPSVVVSLSPDSCLAYNVVSNELHRLNPTAALLIELCDGSRSREMILADVSPLLGPGGMAGCSDWLDQAVAQNLIIEGHSPSPEPMTASELSSLAKELRYKDRVLAAYICQKRAAELEPADPQHLYVLGELAHIVGRRDESRAAYEEYHRTHPEDVEVEHLLIALRDEPPPARASSTYIEQLYSYFAPFYEQNLCGDLDYRAPQLLNEAILAAIENPVHLDVLDLGCGTGLFGQVIRPAARQLTGIDLSQAMVDRAKDRQIYDVLETAEITEWLRRECADRHDLIAICDTLIYFGDLRQVIPQAAKRLRTDGILAFTVEVGQDYPFRLTDSGRFTHHHDHLVEVVREAGMRVITLAAQTLRREYGRAVAGWVAVLTNMSSTELMENR